MPFYYTKTILGGDLSLRLLARRGLPDPAGPSDGKVQGISRSPIRLSGPDVNLRAVSECIVRLQAALLWQARGNKK